MRVQGLAVRLQTTETNLQLYHTYSTLLSTLYCIVPDAMFQSVQYQIEVDCVNEFNRWDCNSCCLSTTSTTL